MKKSTKSTTSNKAQSTRSQRRASSKAKPVTIDLKAEKVAEKDTKSSAAATARNATPRVKKPAASANEKSSAITDTTSTASASKETDKANTGSKESSGFGRNATPSNGKSEKPAAKSPSSKTGKSSSGRFGLFGAALAGGVVALAGAALLQSVGLLPAPGQTDPAAIQQQIAAETAALKTEIADLSSRVNSPSAPADNSVDSEVLSAQIDSILADRLAALPQREGSDLDAVITQVNETTTRVEKLLADQQASAQNLADLQSAVSAGEAGGGAAVSALALQVENFNGNLSKLRDDMEQLKANMAEIEGQSGSQSAALSAEMENRLADLERQTQGLPQLSSALNEAQSAINANKQSLQQQSKDVEQLATSVNKPNSSEKLAAQAVAAAALKNDIDRGVPFESSLQVLQNLSGGGTTLASLAPFAQSGIPTIAQLSSSFASVSDVILAATEPAPGDDLSSRLLAGVKSFVKVKPRKEIEGSTPIALVSQISKTLTDGDLNKASDLWGALPEAGQKASEEWHGQLQSRITANDLISSSVQSFLNSTVTQ